jgi:hypothetical protein
MIQCTQIGGPQNLALNGGCFAQGIRIPVHELLHTLGFTHEMNRPDRWVGKPTCNVDFCVFRDKHIKINEDNIKSGMEDNFKKRSWVRILQEY